MTESIKPNFSHSWCLTPPNNCLSRHVYTCSQFLSSFFHPHFPPQTAIKSPVETKAFRPTPARVQQHNKDAGGDARRRRSAPLQPLGGTAFTWPVQKRNKQTLGEALFLELIRDSTPRGGRRAYQDGQARDTDSPRHTFSKRIPKINPKPNNPPTPQQHKRKEEPNQKKNPPSLPINQIWLEGGREGGGEEDKT